MSETNATEQVQGELGHANEQYSEDDELMANSPRHVSTSPKVRWEYWSTFAAAIILVGTYGAWLWMLINGLRRPESMDFMMFIGLLFALVWTFGKGTAESVKKFRSEE